MLIQLFKTSHYLTNSPDEQKEHISARGGLCSFWRTHFPAA